MMKTAQKPDWLALTEALLAARRTVRLERQQRGYASAASRATLDAIVAQTGAILAIEKARKQ